LFHNHLAICNYGPSDAFMGKSKSAKKNGTKSNIKPKMETSILSHEEGNGIEMMVILEDEDRIPEKGSKLEERREFINSNNDPNFKGLINTNTLDKDKGGPIQGNLQSNTEKLALLYCSPSVPSNELDNYDHIPSTQNGASNTNRNNNNNNNNGATPEPI
jgi:hypothetical protein